MISFHIKELFAIIGIHLGLIKIFKKKTDQQQKSCIQILLS